MSIRGDLDVARLEITMQNGRLAGVQIGQRITDCSTDQDGFIFGDIAHAFHPLAQVLPLNVIHHQILPLVPDHEMIGHARQVGMTQVCKNDRFETELTRIFISREQIFLNSHVDAEVFIHRAVDGTHPTLPEDLDDAISFV